MASNFSVSLEKIIQSIHLEVLYTPVSPTEIQIASADVGRPGLQLAGFMEHFDNLRIQLIGNAETAYMESINESSLRTTMDMLFAQKPPALIVARGLEVSPVVLESARRFEVPVLRTQESTSSIMSSLISLLQVELAPRVTRHGVLVEVYGEGILLLGESGVGKSETAIELVKRGHRLIADDAVEVRRVSNQTLVGSAPENIRHFIELRGIGIINVRRIFGMGAIKVTEKIDMLIQLEQWDQNKVYDRMGMENEYTQILGINVPSLTIPVKPGRNLAIIIEVAAMNNRQKKMGYNAAHELLRNLGMDIPSETDSIPVDQWTTY